MPKSRMLCRQGIYLGRRATATAPAASCFVAFQPGHRTTRRATTGTARVQLQGSDAAITVAVELVEQRDRSRGEFLEIDAAILVPILQRLVR